MHYGIAAGHEVTAEIASEVLNAGGNAYDAAVAAFFGTFVTETMMSSAGGGGFANIYTADRQACVLDFFCHTPSNKHKKDNLSFSPVEVDFGDEKETFYVGLGSMAVPGSIAFCFALNERFGTMSIQELVQPAITLAKEGIALNTFQHFDLKLLEKIFSRSEDGKQVFCNPDGSLLGVGDTMYMPKLVDFLETLAVEGRDLFYKGEIAQSIVHECRQEGGYLEMNDFVGYDVVYREPLEIHFKTKKILLPPAPSYGGRLAHLFLNELNESFASVKPTSKEHLSWLYQAAAKARSIYQKEQNEDNLQKGGTTHFSIIDKWGNAISVTTSIGEGCGWFIPGTDMQMNNMLGELSLLPNGLHTWVPNTRLNSMMTPALVLDDTGDISMSIGTGGASRIPFMISQVLANQILFDMPLIDATELSRMHYEHNVLQVEKGFEYKNIKLSEGDTLNAWNDYSLFFGGVHSVRKEGNHFEAHGDTRRYGVGYTK